MIGVTLRGGRRREKRERKEEKQGEDGEGGGFHPFRGKVWALPS